MESRAEQAQRMGELLLQLIERANQSNGHFTIMKFTTNWRGAMGTIDSLGSIQGMIPGKTFEQVVETLVDPMFDAAAHFDFCMDDETLERLYGEGPRIVIPNFTKHAENEAPF